MGALETDHSHDELEVFSISGAVCFNNEWWAGSDDDDDEIGPPHFRDRVALALHRLVQNPYWTRLWIIQELAVSPNTSTIDWGDSTVSLEIVLTLADIFCKKILDGDTLSSHLVTALSPGLQLLNPITGWQRSGTVIGHTQGTKVVVGKEKLDRRTQVQKAQL